MAFDLKDIVGKIGDIADVAGKADKADKKEEAGDGFDVKELVESAVDKLKGDDGLLDSFKESPIKTIEKLLNIDLPDEILEKIVDAVKAKLNLDDAAALLGKVKGLFDKD